MQSKGKLKPCKSDRIFYMISFLILLFLLLICAYPLYFTLIASISDVNAVNNGEVFFWPKGLTFMGYAQVFKNERVIRGFLNSVLYTCLGTFLNIFMTLTGGYALSLKFPGKRLIMFLITFTMFFGGGMIPTYFVMKDLGLLNNMWVMILPSAVSAYNLIIARTFLAQNIPLELYEAAEMDGCSRLRFFSAIVVPLSTVLIAIIGLFCAVGFWNSYFNAMMYLSDRTLHPLQMVLREILIQNSVSMDDPTMDPEVASQMQQVKELLKYALIVVSSVPMLVLYPFMQKHFVKGIMVGSVKG